MKNNENFTNTKLEWVDYIPSNWDISKAKKLFIESSERGNKVCGTLVSPTRKYGVIPQDDYNKLEGVRVRQVLLSDLTNYKAIHPKDFCISLGSFQSGFEYSKIEGVVSPAYGVFRSIAPNLVCEDYFKWLFKTEEFAKVMASHCMSLRQGKNISFKQHFGPTLLPIPSLPEQKAIAEYLDKEISNIDKQIKIYRALAEKYKELKKSEVVEVINQGIPSKQKRKYQDTGIDWMAKIPVDWSVCKIKDDYNVFKKIVGDKWQNSTRYSFTMNGMVEFSNDDYNMIRSDLLSTYQIIHKNDIVMRLRDLNNKSVNSNRSIISDVCGLVSPMYLVANVKTEDKILNAKHLYYYMTALWASDHLKKIGNNGIRNDINKQIFLDLPISKPPKEELQEIVIYLDNTMDHYNNYIRAYEDMVDKLIEYKKSLIYEYVTGKKRVEGYE